MVDTLIYTLTALAWALWWWLFREARRIEKARRAEREDPFKRAINLAKAASEALAREQEDNKQ